VLTVIFGAGASYDSVPAIPAGNEYRPPLANELFGDRSLFALSIENLRTIQPIIPRLRHIAGRGVESVLMEIQEEAAQNPERSRQLMAVRYYIQTVLATVERGWKSASHGVTNYKTLLDDISQWRQVNETVCLITFNYDTILDDAVAGLGQSIDSLDDYIFGRSCFKLFKVHGSINWVRFLETPWRLPQDLSPWSVAQDNINRAPELRLTKTFAKTSSQLTGVINNLSTIPAIAVPLERKSAFESPDSHLLELERVLPETDRLLVIGWRAMERHFLDLLTKHVKNADSGLIVAKDESEGRDILARIGPALPGVPIKWAVSKGGFSHLTITREAIKLLRRS
jgi:hypothetical protein